MYLLLINQQEGRFLMTKLISIRHKYTMACALTGRIHLIEAKGRFQALARGREWFGNQCFIVR